MGGAKAIPIIVQYNGDGFREELNPSYDLPKPHPEERALKLP